MDIETTRIYTILKNCGQPMRVSDLFIMTGIPHDIIAQHLGTLAVQGKVKLVA